MMFVGSHFQLKRMQSLEWIRSSENGPEARAVTFWLEMQDESAMEMVQLKGC
jgi:hypothetical protein